MSDTPPHHMKQEDSATSAPTTTGNCEAKDESIGITETKVAPLNKYGCDLTNLLSAAVAISQIPERGNVNEIVAKSSSGMSTSVAVSDDDTTQNVLIANANTNSNVPHPMVSKMDVNEIYYQSCYGTSLMHSIQLKPMQQQEKKKRPYNNTRHTFPSKLMEMLNSPNTSPDIIRWSLDGTCFHIVEPTLLCETVLPIYFPKEKNVKFPSFTRKLNRWGFRQTCRNVKTNVFFHKLFLRDQPNLCNEMICKQSERMGSFIKSFGKSFYDEEKLYAYPPLVNNFTMNQLFQTSSMQHPNFQDQYLQSMKPRTAVAPQTIHPNNVEK